MSTVSWVESVPSGTSRVGDFPAFARSVWTAITTGLATSLYWDASGGASSASAGGLRPGGSRAFFGPASASSVPSQGTGRAFLCSDTSRLFMYDSVATWLGGTPFYEEYQSGPPLGNNILMQSGSTTSTWAGTIRITFPTPFAAPPLVQVSLQSYGGVGTGELFGLVQIASTTTNFVSYITSVGAGTPTNVILNWTAIGSSASYL